MLNFSHRKVLVAHSFPSVIWLLVTFRENYFLRDTPQVILILMTPVLSIYHVRGLRKRAVTHTDGKRTIYIDIDVNKVIHYYKSTVFKLLYSLSLLSFSHLRNAPEVNSSHVNFSPSHEQKTNNRKLKTKPKL